MDSAQEAADYDAMDHAEVNRRFVDDLLSEGLLSEGPTRGGTAAGRVGPAPAAAPGNAARDDEDLPPIDVLDLGCGTGQIPVELCRRSPRIRVLAVDLADSMLRVARVKIELAGFYGRIVLDLADAKQLPYESDRFAAVVSNSLVHHLPEASAALAEAVRLTLPGGLIFFRDLLRPPDDAAVKRLVHQYAGGESESQQRLFDASLRAALGLEEVRRLVGQLGFDRRGVRTTSDRHWTWCARKPQRTH